MSREIDYLFYGEQDNNKYNDIYERVFELYKGIGKTIIDIYRDEIVSLVPNSYDDDVISFVSLGIERFLLFGEVAIVENRYINDVDLVRTVENNKYVVKTSEGEDVDLILIRSDILFQEGLHSERLGLSILSECEREIKRYNMVLDATTIAIKSKSIDVFKGELNSFNLENDSNATAKRLNEINHIKGLFSTLYLKQDEDFIVLDKNLSNVDKAIEKVELALCSVSKIPYFRLFGKVSSSQRYSGIEEKKAFYKSIYSLVSVANKLLKYYCNSNKIEFEKITTPQLDIEQEEIISMVIDNVDKLDALGVLSNEEKKSYLKSKGVI